MAALSHAAILVPGVGLIASIMIWVTQREKSRFVRFQALQATIFHVLLVVLYFVGMGCYMVSIFGMIGVAGLVEGAGGSPDPALTGGMLVPLVVLIGMLLIALAMVLSGVVGAVLALRGRNFHYPLLGGWLKKRYGDEQL